MLLFDLDHFKLINDQYGHAIGDRTLQIFADVAKAHIGTAGTLGRWGGDQFVAVLPNTSREIAATVAERIRTALEDAASDIDGRLVGATISTGMAFCNRGAFELPSMLLQADQALYRAKNAGRNRLAIATPEALWRPLAMITSRQPTPTSCGSAAAAQRPETSATSFRPVQLGSMLSPRTENAVEERR